MFFGLLQNERGDIALRIGLCDALVLYLLERENTREPSEEQYGFDQQRLICYVFRLWDLVCS